MLALLAVLGLACGDEAGLGATGGAEARSLPWPATPLPSVVHPPDNPYSEAKAELGRLLFHDPILSADGTVACLTCHSPVWGMSDGLAQSVGVGGQGPVGTGRTGPNLTERNAATLWNVGLREQLFWDGRVESLEAQPRFPLEDPGELGRDPAEVAADLGAIDEYQTLFEAAFPDREEPVTAETMAMALAVFQRTLVSDNSPYDQYARGDRRALTETEVSGMFRFAEAGCHSCHVPPRFDSARFEISPVYHPDQSDVGRAGVTGRARDTGRFRVPTLRNARETWPYFHDGSVPTLEAAVRLELDLRSDSSALTDDDVADLVAFIARGLMDKSRAPHRPDRVPSGLAIPEDAYRVPR